MDKSEEIIITYDPYEDKYLYQAYSHNLETDNVEQLAGLIRKNLLFYCYGEKEVEKYYNNNTFETLEKAAQYAYDQRLPKRNNKKDGLIGEVLLDLIIQRSQPSAKKLAVRTIFRQNDNKEIKGYDLTYFSNENSNISLWLGQSKIGEIDYCKKGLNQDLLSKFTDDYLSKQIYFICDKRVELTDEVSELLEIIEKINIQNLNENNEERVKKLLSFFQEKNIAIKIPCLLTYQRKNVYADSGKIIEKIKREVKSVKNYFNAKKYLFSGITPEIIFYIFPIESLDRIRDEENGFYARLHRTTNDSNK